MVTGWNRSKEGFEEPWPFLFAAFCARKMAKPFPTQTLLFLRSIPVTCSIEPQRPDIFQRLSSELRQRANNFIMALLTCQNRSSSSTSSIMGSQTRICARLNQQSDHVEVAADRCQMQRCVASICCRLILVGPDFNQEDDNVKMAPMDCNVQWS